MSLYQSLRCLLSTAIKSKHQILPKRFIRPARDKIRWSSQCTTRLASSFKNTPQSTPVNVVKHQHVGVSTLDASCDTGSADIQLEADSKGHVLEVSWADGCTSRYHSIWLRNHCHCDACKQPHSGQKLIDQQDIPLHCTLKSTQIQAPLKSELPLVQCQNGTQLKIYWNETDHEGTIPLDFLRENSYMKEAMETSARLRDPTFFEGPIEEFDFKDLSSCKHTFFRWLQCLDVYGIALVTNVGTQEGQVKKVAELIAPIQHTLYGKIFDVIATDRPINVAYSTAPLGFHMDLMYYESPPGLQLLHCLRFDDAAQGGENVFLDVFHSVAEFRKLYPHHFDTFTRVPVTFQKVHFERETPAAYMYQRPHITINPQGQVTSVNWSPPFEGPLKVNEEDVVPYYEAYHTFAALLEKSPVQVEHRLRSGECVIFNNKRILHARKQFTLNNGMQRHYQGCYVNIDDFRNCVQVAYIQHNTGKLAKRCGNQCWF